MPKPQTPHVTDRIKMGRNDGAALFQLAKSFEHIDQVNQLNKAMNLPGLSAHEIAVAEVRRNHADQRAALQGVRS